MFGSTVCFDIRSSFGIPVTNFTYRIRISLYGSESRLPAPLETLSATIKRSANENGPMTLGESWGRFPPCKRRTSLRADRYLMLLQSGKPFFMSFVAARGSKSSGSN